MAENSWSHFSPGSEDSGQPQAAWTVEDHLRGQPASAVELYRRFAGLVEACGPFTYAVSRSSITFKGSRRGFAGARPTRTGLTGYLDLQRTVHDHRITSASPFTKRLVVHQVRITRPEELDEDFAGWVREAYAVGQGAHLHPR
ncbi:MAG: DUF5655 domain-containing protein [Streptosporangiaceae bacterium]|jgi:hypothetical protein